MVDRSEIPVTKTSGISYGKIVSFRYPQYSCCNTNRSSTPRNVRIWVGARKSEHSFPINEHIHCAQNRQKTEIRVENTFTQKFGYILILNIYICTHVLLLVTACHQILLQTHTSISSILLFYI